jgi:hypothetical protein
MFDSYESEEEVPVRFEKRKKDQLEAKGVSVGWDIEVYIDRRSL